MHSSPMREPEELLQNLAGLRHLAVALVGANEADDLLQGAACAALATTSPTTRPGSFLRGRHGNSDVLDRDDNPAGHLRLAEGALLAHEDVDFERRGPMDQVARTTSTRGIAQAVDVDEERRGQALPECRHVGLPQLDDQICVERGAALTVQDGSDGSADEAGSQS